MISGGADSGAASSDAVSLAGDAISAHTEALARSTKIEDARKHFGDLSEPLVPAFLEAKIPNAHGFMCPMLKKQWAQNGETVQNPYYGKKMASCGSPLRKK